MNKKLVFTLSLVMILSLTATGAVAQNIDPPSTPTGDLPDHVPGELLISFNPGVNSAQATEQMEQLQLKLKRQIPALGVKLVKLPPGLTVEEALSRFSRRPGVEYVEPNYILQITAPPFEEVTGQWDLQKINAELAWLEFSGQPKPPILLAAVDTGIDPAHSDLADNIWFNPGETADNGQDDDNNGYVDDDWGWDFVNNDNDPFDDYLHGTAVSGVMAGIEGNGGIAGVCPWCKVMAVKVMNATGTGTLDDVASGIVYATDAGAKVINLSLAGPVGMETLENAVNFAWDRDVLVVAGAGNDGANTPMFPAGYANAMAIGATGETDTHACFSNYAEDYISVVAPGENIYLALPGDSYGIGSGTSISSPLVAGLAGLLLSQDEDLKNYELKSIIESTAVDLSPPGFDAVFGHGRIDAYRAVTNAPPEVDPPPDGLFSTSNSATGYAHTRKLVRANGVLHMIWHTQEGGLYHIRHAIYDDNLGKWNLQGDVFSSDRETYHPAFAADDQFLYVAIPSRSMQGPYEILFTRKPVDSGAWSGTVSLMGSNYDAVRPDLFLDPTNNRLHLVASSLDNAPYVYYLASGDGGLNWDGQVAQVNPSTGTTGANSNTRYASVYANGQNIYIVSRTFSGSLFVTYYMHSVRSTNWGQSWFDRYKISSFLAITSGEYGISLAGVGDRLYMGYEVGSNLYFRSHNGTAWSGYDTLETGDASNINKWPSITQADDGQAWMLFEVNGELYMRHYDGSTWAPKELIGVGNYANLKLGTNGDRVEWITTQCNGAPYLVSYDSRTLGANNPPQANSQVVVVEEDTTLAITLTGSDPDGDPLSFTVVSGPSNGSLTGSDPNLTYNPYPDFNGSDSFTFLTNDGKVNSVPAIVSITVNPINDPPTANNDSATTAEDTQVLIDVTANDTDVDGNLNPGSTTTDCTGCSTTTPGSLVNHSDGTFTYIPAASFNGSDGFVYQICDSDSDCDTATVSITVTPQNNPPEANDIGETTSEEILDTWYPDISDVDDNTFTCEVVNPSTNGATVSVASDCSSGSYLPPLNFNGTDSFIYTACDSGGLCDTGTVTYDVIAVNDYPVAANVSGFTVEETQDTWYPLVNDVDDSSFTCAILITPSSGGTADVFGNCSSGLYNPPPNYYGTDYFTYEACDPDGLCDTGIVTYTITATSMHVGDLDTNTVSAPRNRWNAIVSVKVHDALGNPVANVDVDGPWSAGTSGGGTCTTNSSGECSVTKINIKGNIPSVTFTVDNLAHSTLNYKPSANHDPDPDSLGTTIVVYKDGAPTNQPPTASFTYQCTALTCDFDASNSSDADGTITNFDWTFGDGNPGTGDMINHTYAAEGSYSVVLTVTDNDGLTSSDTQQINLGPAVTQELHVGDIDGSSSPGKRGRWNATAVVTIHSESETMVEGATVTGTWSNGRAMSCTTGGSGSCSFTLSNIKVASISFTVTSVTATGWEYNSINNHDDDDSSNGTSIFIEQ